MIPDPAKEVLASPCRLFVYLAREAPVGVVLRRAPSEWARLSLWHLDDDRIEHGQWIKGRVYERRSDVSPDGSLFAAFVRQSGGRAGGAPAADSWIAISRPPYFTALAVWFVGGTYHTGAFFPGRDALWLGMWTALASGPIGRCISTGCCATAGNSSAVSRMRPSGNTDIPRGR